MNRILTSLAAMILLSMTFSGSLGASPAARSSAGWTSTSQPTTPRRSSVATIPGENDSGLEQQFQLLLTQAKHAQQTQSISIDQGSTTLIDQTSGADLLSTALNLTPVTSGTAASGSGSSTGTQGSGTATSSAYGIWALLHPKQDALKPETYNTHAAWRRFFFTVGREQSTSSSPSNSNSSGTSTFRPFPESDGIDLQFIDNDLQTGTVVGARVLIVQSGTRQTSSMM